MDSRYVADTTLDLPRILCLHGGGTNSRIFKMQCRSLELRLRSCFRLVYAEGPFPSTAGPDVLSVYAECGPFKRWVLGLDPNGTEPQPGPTWQGVEKALGDAMDADDTKGGTGEWVAILGFSQGARMAASILLRQQNNPDSLGRLRRPGGGFRMGVLMAGRGPLLQPGPDVSSLTGWGLGGDGGFDYDSNLASNRVVRIDTLHVHGLLDPGLYFHRQLLKQWFAHGTTKLVEWNGNHRLPFRTHDVTLVVNEIMSLAEEVGIHLR